MNATEQLVELYYRFHKRCFTVTDVKVPNGNNRQLDLLAYCLNPKRAYHVEVSVTIIPRYQPNPISITAKLRRKFLTNPQARMNDAYASFNLELNSVERVFCCWENLNPATNEALQAFNQNAGFQVTILSFRDEVLPALTRFVGTANYEDDLLRTLSLIKQWHLQDLQANLRL